MVCFTNIAGDSFNITEFKNSHFLEAQFYFHFYDIKLDEFKDYVHYGNMKQLLEDFENSDEYDEFSQWYDSLCFVFNNSKYYDLQYLYDHEFVDADGVITYISEN